MVLYFLGGGGGELEFFTPWGEVVIMGKACGVFFWGGGGGGGGGGEASPEGLYVLGLCRWSGPESLLTGRAFISEFNRGVAGADLDFL